MKKAFSILVSALLLFLVSCRKEKIDPSPETPAAAKKLIATTINGSTTISYSPEGKVQTIKTITGTGTYIKEFTHTPAKISYINKFNGQLNSTGEYDLVNGRVISASVKSYDLNGNVTHTETTTYEYNAKGKVSKSMYFDGIYHVTWTNTYDNNGNLVEAIYDNIEGNLKSKYEYTYYNKKDLFPYIGAQSVSGIRFFVNNWSEHLMQSIKETDLHTNNLVHSAVYTYQFDGAGYVISGNVKSDSGSEFNWTNTFQ